MSWTFPRDADEEQHRDGRSEESPSLSNGIGGHCDRR
jgi:hypothetical protein